MRRVLEAVGGVAVLFVAVAWLSGSCDERVPPGRVELGARAPGAPGEPVAVEERVDPSIEWAAGEVASARHTTVSARVLARIEAIPVSAGSRVEEGDVVVVLDARDLQARVGEAEENLRSARAQLDLAQREFTRIQKLFQSGAAARRQLDQATSELQSARARVSALEEARAGSETAASFAELRSPVSGRVVDRLAEPGDMAVPGSPLLRIYDPTLLRVEVPVRETLAVHLRVGQRLRIDVPALHDAFDGSVDEVVPFADPGARTMLVKVRLLATDERLIAGMYARVGIPAGDRRRLLIPAAAVQTIGQLRYVDVVDADGSLERRLVTTGDAALHDRVEVLSGLEQGERVWVPRATAPAPAGDAGD